MAGTVAPRGPAGSVSHRPFRWEHFKPRHRIRGDATHEGYSAQWNQPAPVVSPSNSIAKPRRLATVKKAGDTLTAVALGDHALPGVNGKNRSIVIVEQRKTIPPPLTDGRDRRSARSGGERDPSSFPVGTF